MALSANIELIYNIYMSVAFNKRIQEHPRARNNGLILEKLTKRYVFELFTTHVSECHTILARFHAILKVYIFTDG